MNAIDVGQRADYILTKDGNIVRNSEGDAAVAEYRAAMKDHDRLQAGWTGARVAGLFLEYPWAQSMTITLKVSGDYDDQGGVLRSISAIVSDLTVRDAVNPPENAIVEGKFDRDIGAAFIEDFLLDAGNDMYESLQPEGDANNDITFKVDRRAIQDLLDREVISGHEIFERLFGMHQRGAVHEVPSEEAVPPRAMVRSMLIGDICMPDLVGPYDTLDHMAEWVWVTENASFAHRDNGEAIGPWEFILNLALDCQTSPRSSFP